MTADEQFQILLEKQEAAEDKEEFIDNAITQMAAYILGSICALRAEGKVSIDCDITNDNLEVYSKYMLHLINK